MLLSLVLISLVLTGQGCFNGEVRLNNQASTSISGSQGVVELCHNQTWRPVCFTTISHHEANIICRQQGYSNYSAVVNQSLVDCGLNGIDLLCTRGNESTVQECTAIPLPYTCSNAIVTCLKANCTDTELRLVGGATPWEGRVEVCMGGCWGTVCGERWTNEDAGHVCSRLGYSSTSATLCNIRPGEKPTCNYTRNDFNTSTCSHTQHYGVQCMGSQVNTTRDTECKTNTVIITSNTTCDKSTCDNSTHPTAMNSSNEMIIKMSTCGAYEVFTGLLGAALVGVVIGWIASCLYSKKRHSRGSYAINPVAARQQTFEERESNPPNEYITVDPQYELVTSKPTTDYDTLSRKTITHTGSHDMSHDMLGNMNEYSSIDKSKEIHAYRTLEPANEIVDVKKVGGASPPSIPKEYEIPIPLADTGCELITDKVPTPTEMN